MSDMHLTKTRMAMGAWHGILVDPSAGDAAPKLSVRHADLPVDGVEVTHAGKPGTWEVKVPVPVHAVADGVQTFVIFDAAADTRLAHFTLIAGEAVADDIRSEIDLLRAELDMLKRAFRRHCLETA
jgi:hypothetical protein